MLQGTTGSGKTIVYFYALKEILSNNNQGLILLPEIGLTNQFEKFYEFLVLNQLSGIQEFQRKKETIWNGIATGKIKVVIGARSSMFLPFKNLKMIIIDEEHDQSFKQDEGVIYHARDMAILRASYENIPVNLVTAVPQLKLLKI